MTNKIQHQIASHERATVLSINNFMKETIAVCLFLVYGWAIGQWGSFMLMKYIGVTLLIISVLMMVFFSKLANQDNFINT